MQRTNKEKYNHIAYFNPDVMSIEQAHQDFSCELKSFNAGNGYDNFNDFVNEDAIEYRDSGDGATYFVWNVFVNENGTEQSREVVAFYTLSATAIPYEDRIRLDEEEAELTGKEFDSQMCGISALEIKMFAVDENYQDVFYEFEGEDLPVAAWIIKSIVDYANELINEVLGFKAIFLHSLPNAEEFYASNGFNPVKENMQPLHCIDSEFTAMYLSLKDIHMNYDD